MHKLISWYNANRKKIWFAIIAAVIIIAICYYLIESASENSNTGTSTSEAEITKEYNNDLNSVTLSSSKSSVSNSTISASSEELGTIDSFVEYCNSGNIEEAYNLLSDECKDEMYATVDDFKTNYYDTVFEGTTKNVTMENWNDNIYKVNFKEDALATGQYNSSGEAKQDYITIVKNSDGEYRLNINKFIKRTTSSSSNESDGITIKVTEINTYMDYEIYTFEITNESDERVLVGDVDEQYSMYLQDTNSVKYGAYVHELIEEDLLIEPEETKELVIKYYNKYGSSKNIDYVVFDDVFLNYDTYYEAVATTSKEYTSIYIDL